MYCNSCIKRNGCLYKDEFVKSLLSIQSIIENTNEDVPIKINVLCEKHKL